MNGSGSGSSFSIATTMFVSLAICAVISYGVFYYFKQRLSVIEQSQMEQARVMQAIISRGIHAQAHVQSQAQVQAQSQVQAQVQSDTDHALKCQREITITQNGLIEVSSDSESESESDSESESESDSVSESGSDKWSIGDEIHQPDSYHEEFNKNMLINAICIDSGYVIDSITITNDANECIDDTKDEDDASASNKKIISLNKSALGNDADANESDDDGADDSSSSSSDEEEGQAKPNDVKDLDLDLKIGYKSKKEPVHLNYGNMSVPALRQLAKERGLGGDDGELQKLKKKDLIALLQ